MSVELQKKTISLVYDKDERISAGDFFGKNQLYKKSESKLLPAPTHGDSLGSLTPDVPACQHVSQWPGNGGRMVDVFS